MSKGLNLKLIIAWILLGLALFGVRMIHMTNADASSSQVKTINYQTHYDGKSYDKSALVYLPQNYNPKRRYNIIYLLHGSTEAPRDFFRDSQFKQVLDRQIADGRLAASIVVFPTYYPSRRFISSDYYRDNRLNRAFAKHELVNDLVPAVEGKYRTYAKGTSPAALRASRQHRIFGGFSMGAITTWYVFQYQLPYFSDFLPIAGDSWTVESDGGASAPGRTAKVLGQVAQSNPSLTFHIFAAVGTNDGTKSSMSPQIRAMHRLPQFNDTNLQYYQVPGGLHSPTTVRRAFVHYANQLNR